MAAEKLRPVGLAAAALLLAACSQAPATPPPAPSLDIVTAPAPEAEAEPESIGDTTRVLTATAILASGNIIEAQLSGQVIPDEAEAAVFILKDGILDPLLSYGY